MSLDAMTDDDLRAVARDAAAELARREQVGLARTDVAGAVARFAAATGISAESAWLELCPLPVDVEPAPKPIPDAPEWAQPAGAHDAYGIGASVTYKGAVYESLLAGNAYSPAAYPQGWRKL